MVSECLKLSKICLTAMEVFNRSSTFFCSNDKLAKVLVYCKAMSSECLKLSKICSTALAAFSNSSTFSCLADKLARAIV